MTPKFQAILTVAAIIALGLALDRVARMKKLKIGHVYAVAASGRVCIEPARLGYPSIKGISPSGGRAQAGCVGINRGERLQILSEIAPLVKVRVLAPTPADGFEGWTHVRNLQLPDAH
ncbi:MAG: hypothetical protein ACREQX_14235 [Candidatus Binataceae bacterium]